MIRINKILVGIIIGSFLLIPCIKSYAVKKSSKTVKQTNVQQETVASNSAVIYVFPVNIEKQTFKPVERVITGIFINKQQNEKDKNNNQSDESKEANKDNKGKKVITPNSSNKPREPRLFK